MGDTSTVQINNRADALHHYDAIVIGSGISGGWAAKELCEKGLKTLVLERGRKVEHIKDYATANLAPWELEHRGWVTQKELEANPLISKAAGYAEDTQHFFIKDADHPYVQEKPFDWIRGYQVGGKSLTWGRSCQRWSDNEFTAPQRYGFAVDWPIRYADVAPWYSYAERFAGICGTADNIPTMPDGEFMPGFELNCIEEHLRGVLKEKFNRHYITGRWAQLTNPGAEHLAQGRTQCQSRNLCMRGCPFGAYFSSVSSTLPAAAATGMLTLREHSVVRSIIYDDATQRATGVEVIDAVSKKAVNYSARLIFVCASALNSTLVLLNSKSNRFPNGLGNDSDVLGRYVAFHNYRGSMNAVFPDLYKDKYYYARKPAECVIPNYRNFGRQDTDFIGGYVIFSGGYRSRPDSFLLQPGVGAAFKDALCEPEHWGAYMYMQGETIPKKENHVRLSENETDPYGMPKLITSVGYDDNDDKMVNDFLQEGRKMFEAAGGQVVYEHDNRQPPGLDIHEMGGARMGHDANTSILNKWNQMHACKNVFVTDGACMTSTGNQSPSILYMALTARAVDYAVKQIKQNLL